MSGDGAAIPEIVLRNCMGSLKAGRTRCGADNHVALGNGVATSYLISRMEMIINTRIIAEIIEIQCTKQLAWFPAHNKHSVVFVIWLFLVAVVAGVIIQLVGQGPLSTRRQLHLEIIHRLDLYKRRGC